MRSTMALRSSIPNTRYAVDLLRPARRASSLTPTPVLASSPNAVSRLKALSTAALSSRTESSTAVMELLQVACDGIAYNGQCNGFDAETWLGQHEATIDVERRSGDVPSLPRRQEGHHVADVLGGLEPTERDRGKEAVPSVVEAEALESAELFDHLDVQIGGHDAGVDGVDGDVVLGEFGCKALGHADDGELRCRVGRDQGDATVAADRRHVDDAAAALLDEGRQKCPSRREGAPHVDRHQEVEFRIGHVSGVAGSDVHTRVVDKDVDPTVFARYPRR